jgi:hypothetical protein
MTAEPDLKRFRQVLEPQLRVERSFSPGHSSCPIANTGLSGMDIAFHNEYHREIHEAANGSRSNFIGRTRDLI